MNYVVVVLFVGVCFVLLLHSPNDRTNKYQGLNQDLYEFLELADDAYTLTFQVKDIDYFSKYATDELCYEVDDDLPQSGYRLYGPRNYRIRRWILLDNSSEHIKIKKFVTYKNVKMCDGIQIAIGDDVTETWVVRKDNTKYIVEEITNG